MSTLLMLAVLSAPPTSTSKSDVKVKATSRRFHVIEKDVRNALRTEALARKPKAKKDALLTIIKLYTELKKDKRLESSPTLQTNQKKLLVRMQRIKRKVLAKKGKTRRPSKRRRSLSQRQNDHWNRISAAADDSLASLLSLSTISLGGPSQVFAAAQSGRRGGAAADDGDELVSLIESVIAPDFWDTNGGPGSIRYYKPLHALVVRATSEMHHSLGGVLKGLRKAGN